MIDRIGDDENPDNPVNPVEKDLHVSTCSARPDSLRYLAPLRLCVEMNRRFQVHLKHCTQLRML